MALPEGVKETFALSATPEPRGSRFAIGTESAAAAVGGRVVVPLEGLVSSNFADDEVPGGAAFRPALVVGPGPRGRPGAQVIGANVALRERIAQLQDAFLVLQDSLWFSVGRTKQFPREVPIEEDLVEQCTENERIITHVNDVRAHNDALTACDPS